MSHEHQRVSDHWQPDCSKACSGWQQIIHQSSIAGLFVKENHQSLMDPLYTWLVELKEFICYDIINQLSVPLCRLQSICAQLIPNVGLYSVLDNQLVFAQAPRLLPDPSIPQIHTDSFIMRCQLARIDWQPYYWCRLGQTKSLMCCYRIGN